MAVTSNLFQSAFAQAFGGSFKYLASGGDSFKMALLTSSASPSLSSWVHYSDITNEVSSGSGYTTGGAALASPTVTATVANSWGTAWSATTWAAGAIVIPGTPNGFLYQTPNGGTSTGSAPSFPTVVGETVTDSGGVIWANIGESVTILSSNAVTWSSATFSAEYGVIYDAQSGSGSTEALLALINFGSVQSPSNGSFTVTPPSNGWVVLAPA